ncbi:MAG: zinc-ribbon domain-containing protein [Polyangiaceae bacterium]
MDVTCEHCSTEYEFDDALVSARGTTVQCTHCGYRFRVRAGDPSEDVWRVRTKHGAVLEFTSLQKLQEALVRREVGPSDELTRGRSDRGRPLSSITELEGFFGGDPFLSATTAKRTPAPASVGLGISVAPMGAEDSHAAGPPSVPRRTITLRPDASMPPPSSASGRALTANPPTGSVVDAPEATRLPPVTLREAALDAPPPSSSGGMPPSQRQTKPTFPREPTPDVDIDLTPHVPMLSSPLPPVARTQSVTNEFDVDGEGDSGSISPPAAKRKRVSTPVIGVVLTASIAAASVAWFRFHDTSQQRVPVASTALTADPAQEASLAPIRALLAADDAHGALLAIQKLPAEERESARGKILTAKAHLRKADVRWFSVELASDMSARAAARAQLDEALTAASQSVEKVPENPDIAAELALLRTDLLRLRGERDAARRQLKGVQGEPEDLDYVRGALEATDPQPDLATTLKLLRQAAAREPKPGRATAVMAYALARSGDALAARSELDRIANRTEEAERVAALRVFLTRFDNADASVVADDAGHNAGPLPDDPRRMLADASSALQRGDAARARVLYQGALDKNPSDSEALAGLGDVARSVGDLTHAKEYYQRAITANASFLPALIALADIQWDSGDRGAAARTYQDIYDRIPEGAYPPRVRERRGAAAAPSSATAAPPGPGSPSPSSAPSTDPPTVLPPTTSPPSSPVFPMPTAPSAPGAAAESP